MILMSGMSVTKHGGFNALMAVTAGCGEFYGQMFVNVIGFYNSL